MKELIEKINKLKKEKKAVILVHNYQRPEMYEVADSIGDSLALSRFASTVDADIIIFCGADFMAETAKIINPDKKVLLPAKGAVCPMASMVDIEELRALKREFPEAAVVSYVNTSAEVKAESDYCCTSMNAIKVVNSIPNKKIIFTPDYHLGNYVKSKTDKEIILWDGYCYVHSAVIAEKVEHAKKNHPDAKVIAHPECPMEVLKLADHICGTGGMIKYAKENDAKEFIILTESGMVNRLHREVPEKKFYAAAGICFTQKFITLQNLLESLQKEQYEVKLDKEVIEKAKKAVDRMLEIK